MTDVSVILAEVTLSGSSDDVTFAHVVDPEVTTALFRNHENLLLK